MAITTLNNGDLGSVFRAALNSMFSELYTGGSTAAASITAYATGGQANATALTGKVNQISTCATSGDSVKLPAAVAGLFIVVINSGAADCAVFPASGDDLGAGIDTSSPLASGDAALFAAYDATNWQAISTGGGGATGGGTDEVFLENDQLVTANYTITTGKNAHSVGDITINAGVTVTVPSGSRWVIS